MTQSFSSRQRQEASMVIPDDFTILTGDMKLEHLSTLHTLNELKRNLKRGENKEPSHHLYTATLVYSLKKKKKNLKPMQSVQVVWQTRAIL